MTLVDYASNFWGDKHIGYNVLYENMKKGEESVHELLTFLKERINVEDDLLKSLGKSLHRVNGYVSNNSGFVDAWKLARETLELWTEIQSTLLKNLNELLKEVTRYQEELGRMRKRAKDADTLETINLMQTTTTCLQKARDTYNQRCGEVGSLKQNNKEWTAASTREYLKARNKLNKAHEEYRLYMEKYSQIRDTFEERISNAARSFQEHDRLHLLQMKKFFAQMAKCFETGHGSHAQVGANLRQNVEQNINVEDLMLRFIDEKGTGTEPPQKLQWTDADELPPDLDVVSCVQSQSSSSNSSAIIPNPVSHQFLPSVNHLLGLDDSWMTVGGESGVGVGAADVQANASGSIGGGFGESIGSFGVKRGSANGFSEHNKSGGDSDSERHSEMLFSVPSSTISSTAPTTTSASSSSYVPLQISSWLGRQKLSGPWRLKKHFSASQSNLAGSITIETPTVCGNDQTKGVGMTPTSSFSKSCNDTSSKMVASGLLKRYQKGKAMKSSMGDLTLIGKAQPELTLFSLDIQNNVASEHEVVRDPLEVFGPPPPLPVTDPPSLDGELADTFSHYTVDLTRNYPFSTKSHQQQIRQHSVSFVSTCSEGTAADEQQHQRCASSSSTSSDEEEACMAAQRSKIRQLQIRPLNASQQSKLNASVDELRMAIGQISLSKCKGCENDPWGGDPTAARDGPIRAALTGDEQHLRQKCNEFPFSDFSQSVAALSAGSTISRARPRSHTPLPSKTFGVPGSSTAFFGTEPNRSETPSTPTPDRPFPASQTTPSSIVPLSADNELSTPSASVTPNSFETPATLCGGPFAQNFFISPSPMAIHPSASFSASNFKVPGTVPIAMAINEYLHVWIKPNCPLRFASLAL
uniref:F-BAR domain-containing protein n=1 Tax=Globodera rostochiensis TaxID=31243 RepID=A0A914HXW2_GLORO